VPFYFYGRGKCEAYRLFNSLDIRPPGFQAAGQTVVAFFYKFD
jgi:hypothetical protein